MKLKRELEFWDIFSISSGAMISSGIFVLPAVAFARSGPSIIFSYFLGGIIAMIGIMAVVELTTAMPKAGGDYFFIMRTLGPLVGTISGILSWFAIALKTAFAILGLGGVLAGMIYGSQVNQIDIIIVSLLVTLFFLLLNIVGVEVASKFENIIVAMLFVILIVYIILGIGRVEADNFFPFIQKFKFALGKYIKNGQEVFLSLDGFGEIISTSAFIFVSFGGLLKVSTVAEEVKDPGVNIPKGIFYSIGVITIIYTLVLIVTVGIGEGLANSINPIADTANIFLGSWGYVAVTFGAILAFVSTANAGIMAASRYPLALSRDRLLPYFIAKIHPKYKTPIVSIFLTGIFIALSIVMSLETLAKTASAVILMTYILTNLSLIIIRESNIVNYKPTFKVYFYPWLQIFTIVVFLYFIRELGVTAVKMSLILVILSFIVYFTYGKKHSSKEYALLHLLLRITESINFNHDLEGELRDIIHERENIELDVFDQLVKEATILDLKGPMELDSLFEVEAERLSNILNKKKEELIYRFNERERESSTAITEFTAIPHIIIEDMESFHMVVIRCREGIKFNDKKTSVKAVFMFISSKNLRKTHLKILASIASLIKEEGFEKRWVEAKNEDYLRDIVLLSKRERK